MEKIVVDKSKFDAYATILELILVLLSLNCVFQVCGLYSFEQEGAVREISCIEEINVGEFSWQKYFMSFCDSVRAEEIVKSCELKNAYSEMADYCNADVKCMKLKYVDGNCMKKYWYEKEIPSPTIWDYLKTAI